MKVSDEVCGMGFGFCGKRCKRLFKEHPGRYVPVEPGTEGE